MLQLNNDCEISVLALTSHDWSSAKKLPFYNTFTLIPFKCSNFENKIDFSPICMLVIKE